MVVLAMNSFYKFISVLLSLVVSSGVCTAIERGITRVGEEDCTETTVDYIQFSEVFSRI